VDWLSIVIGGVITLFVSLMFYVPSAISLKRESARLRDHTTLILRGLEEAGLVEYNRDDQGEIIGVAFKRQIPDAVSTSDATMAREVHRREADTDAPVDQE